MQSQGQIQGDRFHTFTAGHNPTKARKKKPLQLDIITNRPNMAPSLHHEIEKNKPNLPLQNDTMIISIWEDNMGRLLLITARQYKYYDYEYTKQEQEKEQNQEPVYDHKVKE